MRDNSKRELVRSAWTGHVEKMGYDKLAKRADAQKVEVRKTRNCDGDCIRSDLCGRRMKK